MTKGFFQSKTILIALVSLVLAILGFFLKKDFSPEVAQQIAELDWLNWSQALLSTLLIIIRVIFPPAAKIRGAWSRVGSIFK